MQSADIYDKWLMEFINNPKDLFKENIMGRTSSSDMSREIKLFFSNPQDAVDFAKKRCYSYEVIKSQESPIRPKNYASNFR